MSSEDWNDRLKTGGALDVYANLFGRDGTDVRGLIGRQLGEYEIIELIAEGGMGLVFRARRVDGSFDRDVAIKLSPISGLNRDLRERFLREQDVLAGLNHPNITQLYDAGVTEEGWPYLVMELIDGVPIDRYCETAHLDIHAIVDLMIETAGAVAFAHARLIVHRDIKPSNVLVTADGRPKLLDFGIAKLLADSAGTATQANPMTPQYASPEQLLGREIGVGSDIFQLGRLLEVLISGRPREPESLEAGIERATRGEDIRLAPDLRRRLPRDLQAVIEKSLRAEPDQRYPSATSLVEDLRRLRRGYPVTARNAGAWYRAVKMARRNAPTVITATASVLVLVVSTVWYTRELADSRDAAQQAASEAEDITDFMVELFARANPDKGGKRDLLARELLDQAVSDADGIAGQPSTRAAVLRTIGRVYLELGDPDGAETLFDQALTLQRANLPEGGEGMAEILFALGVLAFDRSDFASALELYEEGHAILRESYSEDAQAMIRPWHLKGNVLARLGNLEQAAAAMENTLALQRRHLPPTDEAIAVTLNGLGLVNLWQGNVAESQAHLRAALEHLEEAGITHTSNYPAAMDNLALALGHHGNPEEAFELRRRALPLWVDLYGEDHRFVAESLNRLAISEQQLNGHAAAIEYFDQSIGTFEAASDPPHPSIFAVFFNRAAAYEALGEYANAMADAEAALTHAERSFPDDHWRVGELRSGVGMIFVKGGRVEEGRAMAERGLEIIRESELAGSIREAVGLGNLAECYSLTGDRARAEALYVKALTLAENTEPDADVTAEIRKRLTELRSQIAEEA